MADLIKEANYLRFYHTSEDMLKDKDLCKNDAYERYGTRTTTLMIVPLAFQIWQINVANNAFLAWFSPGASKHPVRDRAV